MSRRRERIYPFRIGVRHGMHECIPYEANDNHDNQTRANTLPGTVVTGSGRIRGPCPGGPGGPPLREGRGCRERIYPFRIGVRHGMHKCIPYEVGLASLFEGGGRRPEGVSYEHREWPIIPTTPPQSAKLTAPPEGEPRAGD